MFPAGILSIIWHYGPALNAPHPEVTLSCFYALRGHRVTAQRKKKNGIEGGKVHLKK